MYLFELPVVVLEHVFAFLTYDDIARSRIVCKDFDNICKRILNRGFHLIEKRHALCLRAIKALLPRRESERRSHNLARHCDILTSVETRLSMLSMTYSKYIDNNMCCFIPGKVLDEVQRVLSIVESTHALPRAHEVLQELRDISSMAIEHFDDRVAPKLRMKMLEKSKSQKQPSNQPATKVPPPGSIDVVRSHYMKGQRALLALSKRLQAMEKKMKSYKEQLTVQKHMILHMSKRQSVQNANMAELKKRIEECDVKYRELSHSQGISGGAEVCPPAPPDSESPPMLRHYSSQIRLDPVPMRGKRPGRGSPNIKPRKTTLDHPTLNILTQSLGTDSRAKRPRLSNMSMEDSPNSDSNSSQDIRDITDDQVPHSPGDHGNSSCLDRSTGKKICEHDSNVASGKRLRHKLCFINKIKEIIIDDNQGDENDDCVLVGDNELE